MTSTILYYTFIPRLVTVINFFTNNYISKVHKIDKDGYKVKLVLTVSPKKLQTTAWSD